MLIDTPFIIPCLPMFTASIVIHDTPLPQLSLALESLYNTDVSKIYLIDNGRGIDPQSLKKLDPRIVYQKVPNRGFGAAHNIAIREAINENSLFHLVLNPDVYWKGEDPLKLLIARLQLDSSIGLIAPKLLNPDGSLQYSCRRLPSPFDSFSRRFLPSFLIKKRMDRYLLKDYDHESELNVPYLLGAFMLFRIEALKDCGLFDERFFLYPEDIDITRRIHQKWKTLYFPTVSVYHEHQRASAKNPKLFLIHLVNMIRYFNKWGWS